MNSTPIKQLGSDNTPTSVETNNKGKSNSPLIDYEKNEESIRRETIDGTPFLLMWTKEKNYFAAYKGYQITKECESKEEVVDEINYNTWHIIQLLIQISIVETDNMKEQLAKAAAREKRKMKESKK